MGGCGVVFEVADIKNGGALAALKVRQFVYELYAYSKNRAVRQRE